jgi:hypothetical protein
LPTESNAKPTGPFKDPPLANVDTKVPEGSNFEIEAPSVFAA